MKEHQVESKSRKFLTREQSRTQGPLLLTAFRDGNHCSTQTLEIPDYVTLAIYVLPNSRLLRTLRSS